MATPMTANQFLTLLEKWHLSNEPIKPSWAEHNRIGHGDWGPMNGVILHHTGSDDQSSSMRNILWNGYDSLPGPICHAGIDVHGKLWLAGWGRANHAGLGDSAVLGHVIREDYTGNLKPTKANTDGNSHFYGFEIMYSGSHAMSDEQYKTAVRVSAAICNFHKWTEKSVIGHGEWQPGKWDPGYASGHLMDMSKVRGRIQQAIKEGPVSSTKPTPAPVPIPTPAPTPKVYDLKAGDTIRIGGSTLKVTEVK